MAQHLYLLPVIRKDMGGTAEEPKEFFYPKYLDSDEIPGSALAGLEGAKWVWEIYFFENGGLLAADLDATQDSLLSGQSDVTKIPDDLSATIPNNGVRNQVRAALEALEIPGEWVNTGMTYRIVVRVVLGIFQFHNRYAALTLKRVLDGTLNLGMTVGDIPVAKRNKIAEAASNLGLDVSGVTNATTIRQLFVGAGQQFAAMEFVLSGSTINMVI